MRKLLFLCALLVGLLSASAQDVITFNNRTTVEAKVIAEGTSEISHKKWSNPDGPSYNVATKEIASISYENGREEVFAKAPQTSTQSRITQTAVQAYNERRTAEEQDDNKYLKKRHFRFGIHGTFGLSTSGSSDGKDAALMGSESAWSFKASVEYFPNLATGSFFYGGYIGLKGVSTSSNFTINGQSLDDSPLYFVFQPIVGFEYKQFFMKTGLSFDFLASDDEPYKSLTNSCIVGWPFEIGWTKKFWEIGLYTNVGFSNMYKKSKSRPFEFGVTLGVHI